MIDIFVALFCYIFIYFLYRSSHPKVLCKKGVLKNFDLISTLLKKRLWHKCFPVNFVKFLTTPFFYRTPLVAASVSITKL